MKKHLAVALACLFVPALLPAQSSPKAPQIHVTTHLVQIGIIVRDKNGPVAKLTKDDFVILDRGKPQEISVFSVESSESAPQPAQSLPPNTFSDLLQYGTNKPKSVTIVLLDNLNTLSGSSPQPYETTPYWLEDHALANAKQHLIEFLKKLDSNNRIAIYGLSDSLHVLCDFTCDGPQLLAVVSKYDPTSKTQRETVGSGQFHLPNVAPEFDEAIDEDVQRLAALTNQARAQTTMAALVAIATHVADVPGRKNLLWLTANLPFSGQAIARVLGLANIAAYPVDARGLLPRSPTVSPEAGSNVGDAYVRGALGMNATPTESDDPIGVDAMQKMAEETGGRAFVNTNDLTGAIRDAVEDSAVTYSLGFYIHSDSLDGKFHELKVKVKRSGLDVRYPKGYFALKDAPATKDELHNSLVAAIRSPLDASAIPLQIKVDRVNQPAPNSLSLLGSINIHDLQLAKQGETRTGVLDITVLEQDQTGKVVREYANRIDLRFTEKQYAAVLQSGINFRKSLQAQAGVTTLRVLVQDPGSAAIGSLIIPLSSVN
ncbi:MAG: VWA domain-containing protein [Candidatus Acidiferrum sp.]